MSDETLTQAPEVGTIESASAEGTISTISVISPGNGYVAPAESEVSTESLAVDPIVTSAPDVTPVTPSEPGENSLVNHGFFTRTILELEKKIKELEKKIEELL